MKWRGNATLAVLVLGCALFTACASRSSRPIAAASLRTDAAGQDNAFGGIPPVELPADARAMGDFLKAEVASDNGDRKDALTFYQSASEADPNNASIRLKLASLYVRDGQLKKALSEVNQALVLDPKLVDARLLAAGLESATGDDAKAEAQYQQVLKTDPKSQEAYLYLGTLYAKQGKYDASPAHDRRRPQFLSPLLLRRTRGRRLAKLQAGGRIFPYGVDA